MRGSVHQQRVTAACRLAVKDRPFAPGSPAAIEWLRSWQNAHTDSAAFRRANASSPARPPQRVPRQIFHTIDVNASAFVASSDLLSAWRSLNPEYDWHLFDEADCTAFVEAVAAPKQRWAYRALATGAARSDLFRVLAMLHLGGVYADVDVELRRPLRTLIRGDDSMVMSPRIATEWLIMEAGHPLLKVLARSIVASITKQVTLWQSGSDIRCKTPQSCIVETTGPVKFAEAFKACSVVLGCAVNLTRYPYFQNCSRASNSAARQSRACIDEQLVEIHHAGTGSSSQLPKMLRGWDCGVAFHRHCSRGARHGCSVGDMGRRARHYSSSRHFFNVDMHANVGPAESSTTREFRSGMRT